MSAAFLSMVFNEVQSAFVMNITVDVMAASLVVNMAVLIIALVFVLLFPGCLSDCLPN